MTTNALGHPADLKRSLSWSLQHVHDQRPFVTVTPRDAGHRQCAAWCADYYEVWARYPSSDIELGPLEEALGAVPGAYMTTQVVIFGGIRVSNPDFPAALGVNRRGGLQLPGVYALLRD